MVRPSILKLAGGVYPYLFRQNHARSYGSNLARSFSTNKGGIDDDAPKSVDDYKDPFKMLKEEFKRYATEGSEYKGAQELPIPRETEICIIGGGAVGTATSLFLKKRSEGIKVAVVERDPSVSFRNYC